MNPNDYKFCPHGWPKFQQAQRNMMRFWRNGRKFNVRSMRRSRKWAGEFEKWIHRIWADGKWRNEPLFNHEMDTEAWEPLPMEQRVQFAKDIASKVSPSKPEDASIREDINRFVKGEQNEP